MRFIPGSVRPRSPDSSGPKGEAPKMSTSGVPDSTNSSDPTAELRYWRVRIVIEFVKLCLWIVFQSILDSICHR
jgi:hypothetical protein